jgi:orotidine-5'-phosphate decarboxylase
MDFVKMLEDRFNRSGSLICVGLDSDASRLPRGQDMFSFNKAIIDATADLVCSYKLNSAYYEAAGTRGIEAMRQTFDYIHTKYPDIPTILDAKRADIGSTNNAHVRYAFEYLGADSITVQPYPGHEALEPFLACKDKGIIVWCRSSNPGAAEIQDLMVNGKKVYQILAENVRNEWNYNNNCLIVVGATYPEEMAEIRQIVGDDITFLVPGVGKQGGSAEEVIKNGINSRGTGLIIHSAREIIFASSGKDFAEAARQKTIELKNIVNEARSKYAR